MLRITEKLKTTGKAKSPLHKEERLFAYNWQANERTMNSALKRNSA